MGKILLYFLMFFITVFSIDSININRIFKPNKVLQARMFYFLLTISISYMVTNFFYDLYLSTL